MGWGIKSRRWVSDTGAAGAMSGGDASAWDRLHDRDRRKIIESVAAATGLPRILRRPPLRGQALLYEDEEEDSDDEAPLMPHPCRDESGNFIGKSIIMSA